MSCCQIAACPTVTASPEEEEEEQEEEEQEEELHLQPTNQVVQMCQACQYAPGRKHHY